MHTTRLTALLALLIFSFVILVMHLTAMEFYLYWRFWWFDLVVHALGGALIACGALVFGARGIVPIIAALFIGVLWEIMEYTAGIRAPYFLLDTSLDLLFDTIGAVVLCGIVKWWLLKSQ